MPDILNDIPSDFVNEMPDLNNDLDCHDRTREALRALNRFAFGERGARGLTSRSIVEDGAIADDLTDNRAQIQATLDAVALAGGGIALVPAVAKAFRWLGTITIPLNVTLSGFGYRSVLRGLPAAGQPAIRFAGGIHRGGVERLQLLGLLAKPPAIDEPRVGIDLSGAQFLRLHDLQIWDFPIGVVLSDGVTEYAGCNHLGAFEINHCDVGLRAFHHCNGCSVREGRIWFCRNTSGTGVAIDVDSADVLGLEDLVVENFDLGVRVRGLTKATLRNVYYEADLEGETSPGRWLDIQPALGSTVKLENSQVNVSRSITLAGSLEDAVTTDSLSHYPFGAKRHHAAAPERNLLENGDFRRGDDGPVPLGWQLNFAPTAAPNIVDFVTAPRSYDITQTNDANDGIATSFTVPETTDFVSVMVRFKNILSTGAFFTLVSGTNVAQFPVSTLPDPDAWQVAAWTVAVDPAAAGVVAVILTADQTAGGGHIRVDEVWAVVGATAAPPRAHAHRIEMLPDPVTLLKRVVEKTETFGQLDLRQVQGLGRPPRGVIGAVLSIRGTASPVRGNGGILDPSGIGATLPRAVRPFIRDVETQERWALNLIYDRLEHDRQVIVRGLTFVDGADLFTAEFFASYRIDLVGWVHPS